MLTTAVCPEPKKGSKIISFFSLEYSNNFLIISRGSFVGVFSSPDQYSLLISQTSHYHCLYVCKDNKKRKFFPFSRFQKDDKSEDGRSLHYRDKEDVWDIKREYWSGDEKTPTKLHFYLLF